MEDKIERAAQEFCLSPKETAVFKSLVLGNSAKEIAQMEGLTYETARWYIKQIYQKTGVNRQTEIMRILIE